MCLTELLVKLQFFKETILSFNDGLNKSKYGDTYSSKEAISCSNFGPKELYWKKSLFTLLLSNSKSLAMNLITVGLRLHCQNLTLVGIEISLLAINIAKIVPISILLNLKLNAVIGGGTSSSITLVFFFLIFFLGFGFFFFFLESSSASCFWRIASSYFLIS